MGEVGREADRRPHRRRRLPHSCLALEQTTTSKKERFLLSWRVPAGPGPAPGPGPRRVHAVRDGTLARQLIAQ